MIKWTIEERPSGLRISPFKSRSFGSEKFTWAHLLYNKLYQVQVYVIYFPSRFELKIDAITMQALRVFGMNTGEQTLVNFWDPKDPQFSTALALFDQKSPPALILATGLKINGISPYGPDKANIYAITFTDQQILENSNQLVSVVNNTHELLMRGNPEEITSYLRRKNVGSLLSTIAKILGGMRDEFLKFKPKLQLPDGTSIQLGG